MTTILRRPDEKESKKFTEREGERKKGRKKESKEKRKKERKKERKKVINAAGMPFAFEREFETDLAMETERLDKCTFDIFSH